MNSVFIQTDQPEKLAMALQLKSKSEGICMTEEQYLTSELASEVKREYIDGQAYAMSGASDNHGRIAANIARELGNHLKGAPCEVFIADLKVRFGKDYLYPDVMVDCRDGAAESYFAQSPVLIVEVLSDSTRRFDLTKKLIRYINIPSLKEYVVLEQNIVSVQVFRKSNHWRPDYYFLGDTVTFESIGLTLSVEDIYDRVDNKDMCAFKTQKEPIEQNDPVEHSD